MAWSGALFLLASGLAGTSPAALGLQATAESGGVKVPRSLLFAYHHDHESCSTKVPRAVIRQELAARRDASKHPGKGHVREHEQDRTKAALQRIFSARAVDFTGKWMMFKVEGDMDKLLMKMGVSNVDRQAARMFDYGVGQVTEEIEQNGDDLAVRVKSVMGTTETKHYIAEETMQMKVQSNTNKKKQDQIKCTTSWSNVDKNELVHSSKITSGKKLPELRRSIDQGMMVVKMIIGKVEAKVYYQKQD
mmetsp:Transcript_103350/g.292833  ORF Transcript_103350/g.292833 Transcript_103350/m.292833 type:complete len:248 (+) Transcript_103350:69-812(+)